MIAFKKYQSLKDYTTLGIGGHARYFIEVTSIEQLKEVLSYCNQHSLRFFTVGKGSNVIFDDRGFDGVVILNRIVYCVESSGIFDVGAGYSFSLLGTKTARNGWAGLEFASGIPGSVGGAIYMNAGANGGDVFNTLQAVTYLTQEGELKNFSKDQLEWGYRYSSFQKISGVIISGVFHLESSADARQKQLKIIDYRTKSQPYKDMSAGCIFRNATGKSAGALIEECGLKGKSIGGAKVSPMHANFIINTGHATANDLITLSDEIQNEVYEKTGIMLEREVRVVPYE